MNETVTAFLKVSQFGSNWDALILRREVKCSSVSLFLRQLFRSFIVENTCSHIYDEANIAVTFWA